jgi:hypothetical protein
MALDKQQVAVNFSKGLDTKSDPWQVPIGSFLELENSVFTKQGLLQKRNGFELLGTLSDKKITTIATLNDQLTLIGDNLFTYKEPNNFFDRGFYKPAKVETQNISRSGLDCIQSDSTTINGITCIVYTEELIAGVSYNYKYTIINSENGQTLVAPTFLTGVGGTVNGSPRVYAHNNNFVIFYSVLVGGADNLQYTVISSSNYTVQTAQVLSTNFANNNKGSFDAVNGQGNLYVAWRTNNATSSVLASLIDPSFIVSSPVTVSVGVIRPEIVTCAFDTTTNNLSVCYYDSGSGGGTGPNLYLAIRSLTLNSVLAQTTVVAAPSPLIANVTLYSDNGTNVILYERINYYTYTPTVPTNYISKITVTTAGVIGTPSVFIRGNGLSSKLFKADGNWYVSTTHQSTLQDGYFVLNMDAKVVAKYAYELGDGYVTRCLPNVVVEDNTATISYLYKTGASSGSSGSTEPAAANLVYVTIGGVPVYTSEIANTLNISGGILWSYDGVNITENNFLIYPENVYARPSTSGLSGGLLPNTTYFYTAIYSTTDANGNIINSGTSETVQLQIYPIGGTFTATASLGSNTLTGVSTFTNIQIGQTITGLGIATSAVINAIDTTLNTVTMSVNANANAVGATYTVTQAPKIAVINVPTLRTTNRTQASSLVSDGTITSIFLFRSSTTEPLAHVVGSDLNNKAVDSVQITDSLSDTQIQSTPVIYTTGGVLPNRPGPPCTVVTLFDNRLWVAESERNGYLWFSKLVVPGTPVEMSSFQTYYVSPTVGAQGYTGKITALSPMDEKLVIFKEDAIYYINGVGPDATGANSGYSEPIYITATVGCKYPDSVLIMPNGLMFQSDKGIWMLGRDTSTSYIGAPVESFTQSGYTLKSLTIPNTNEVRFVLSSGITLMYDYFFQQWGSFTNIPATTATLYKQAHTFFDEFGRIFKENPGSYVDGNSPVLMRVKTGWFALAGILGFQRAYFMFLLAKYYTPHKITVDLAYDFNPYNTQTTVITPNNYNDPFGGDPFYGTFPTFGGVESVERWRIMFQRQKCDAVQITLQESYDSSLGVPAGAGFTLSGINFIVGIKREFNTVPAAITVG